MARHLNFTDSIGGGKHASTYVEFRIPGISLAWAYAEEAAEQNKSPRLITQADAEKRLRRELWLNGMNWLEIDHYCEVEEYFTEAYDHVKEVYGIEG